MFFRCLLSEQIYKATVLKQMQYRFVVNFGTLSTLETNIDKKI